MTGISVRMESEAWHGSFPFDVRSASTSENLYEEVSWSESGQIATQLNVAMAVSDLGTSLTTDGMLHGAKIKPASATKIQQTCNKLGQIITDANKKDIKKIRQNITTITKKP